MSLLVKSHKMGNGPIIASLLQKPLREKTSCLEQEILSLEIISRIFEIYNLIIFFFNCNEFDIKSRS